MLEIHNCILTVDSGLLHLQLTYSIAVVCLRHMMMPSFVDQYIAGQKMKHNTIVCADCQGDIPVKSAILVEILKLSVFFYVI